MGVPETMLWLDVSSGVERLDVDGEGDAQAVPIKTMMHAAVIAINFIKRWLAMVACLRLYHQLF